MGLPHPFLLRALGSPTACRQGGSVFVEANPMAGLPAEYVALLAGQPAIGLQPLKPMALDYARLDDDAEIQLSSHAIQRRRGAELVWEDVSVPALCRCYGAKADELMRLIAQPTTARAAAREAGLELAETRQALELLVCAGLARPRDRALSALDMWTPREAWLHAQSWLHRTDTPLGGVYPFREVMPAPAAHPPVLAGPVVALGTADLPLLSLGDALSRRRSRRKASGTLDVDRLAVLLQHAAKASAIEQAQTVDDYEVRRHPYPTAGGMGELELYLLVERCTGLEAGLYHYDAIGHRLETVALESDAASNELRDHAAWATASGERHDAVLLITSRITRPMWKYHGISYGLTLRNTGALMQSISLVATALDIASCTIGLGPHSRKGPLLKGDGWMQPQVGLMALNG